MGSPLDKHPHPRPERRGSSPPGIISTLFLSGVFLEIEASGKEPARRGENSSDPATSWLGAPPSPRPARPPPRALLQELRSPSSVETGAGASRTASDECPGPSHPSPLGRRRDRGAKLTWPERGAGVRGRRCPSAGADKLSRAPSGHRLVARLRTHGRGAASPGRRAGGGRRRGRQGRGGRGAAWDLRRPPGAQRVLPPAPPLSPPRPASCSPPPRRVGPGRAERREIVSTANKKRRHMTRQEEGKRGEGVERRGGTERRGRREPERGKTWARPPAAWGAGRGPAGAAPTCAPCAAIGDSPGSSRDAAGAQAGLGRKDSPPAAPRGRGSRLGAQRPGAAATVGGRAAGAGGAWPVLLPGLRPRGRAGAAPLASCLRNAPTPSACLTWLESKNKKNYDAAEACEGEKRFHFSPAKASWRDSQGLSPALLHRPPRAPGGKAQTHCNLRPRWPLLQSLASACLPREEGWPLQITEQEACPTGHAAGASPRGVLNAPTTSKPLAETSFIPFTF